jgi:hypothetical protein
MKLAYPSELQRMGGDSSAIKKMEREHKPNAASHSPARPAEVLNGAPHGRKVARL